MLSTCEALRTDVETLKIHAAASDRRVEVQRELVELTDTVDALRESSKGYQVVRNRFLDKFKKNRLNVKLKQLNDKVFAMNESTPQTQQQMRLCI